MARKVTTSLVLLAFTNFIVGCVITDVEKALPEKEHVGSGGITEVILADGSAVRCEPDRIKLREARIGLKGRTASGRPTFVPLERLREVRISPPRPIAAKDLDTASVAEVVLQSHLLVAFQKPGARYDAAAGKLRGTTTGGREVEYRSDLIHSMRGELPAAVTAETLRLHPEQPVYEAVDVENTATTFDSTGALLEGGEGAMFVGTDAGGRHVEIPASEVLYVNVVRVNAAGTVLATLGLIAAVGAVAAIIVAATKQSCPFVYSFDGERYVFDAEPLGGAICRGLSRTDISRLDHARAAEGEYRFLVRNEVPETQYIDRMRLRVVDHPGGSRVYPDLQGTFYAFTTVGGAARAIDEKGKSLTAFLQASDNVSWQTSLSSASREVGDSVRHTLTVTFPKPAGATRAWLVTNIGTSIWGSNMIRKTVEYRGNTAETWLRSVVPGSQPYAEMYQFIEREEMYQLKTWVKEGESWRERAVILGQGPLISEDRVYPIDISNAEGDSLVLRFHPPKGFWTFDYIGVSYETPPVIAATTVEARRAEDQRGRSILDSLRTDEGSYYTMPEVGDWAVLSFDVPPLPEGTTRAVYLETSGYYALHLPTDKPDQLARLYHIWVTPGQIVRTTMEEFRVWEAEQQTLRVHAEPRPTEDGEPR